MTYFIVSNIFLYVLMIPDIGLLRDRFPGRRWLYKPLSMAWAGTEGQWRNLGKVIGFLCVAVIPIAVSVHTVVSWVFGMQTQPMWHSSIFAPYFVTGAIYSGIAVIIIVAVVLRKVYHLEEYFKPYHFNNMGLLLLTFTLLWAYFTFAEHLTAVYGGDSFELAVFWSKVTGKFAPLFWIMIFLCFVVPFPILVFKRTIPGLLTSSIAIVIGMWLERFLIIIPSFSQPRLPYARGAYMPSWVEWSMMAGLCAGFTLAFVLFSKFFPVISIWELEKEEKEKIQ
jgi:molybdopterin-containing oxidoreductase family membrane subunit